MCGIDEAEETFECSGRCHGNATQHAATMPPERQVQGLNEEGGLPDERLEIFAVGNAKHRENLGLEMKRNRNTKTIAWGILIQTRRSRRAGGNPWSALQEHPDF